MEPLTQQEWDKRWMEHYDAMWIQTRSHDKSFAYAHKKMLADFGPRPEGEPGLPWWLKLAALTLGVNMQKIWDFLNGKKLIAGAILTALTVLAGYLPAVLAFFGVDAVQVAQYVGIATMVVGVAHKIYKFLYKEDHP
jgi:hypothetical protein